MGGARARRLAERLRLSSTSSVAGGWTMAWSASRPPQAHARPSTWNTRQSKSAQRPWSEPLSLSPVLLHENGLSASWWAHPS